MNADGKKDILIGSFSGVPQWIERTNDGWKEPTEVLDKNGDAVLISKFWNHETEEWDETDRSGTTGHCTSVAAVDWDGDGDTDLVLGAVDLVAKKGEMFVRLNEGNAKESRFSTKNQPIKVGGDTVNIEGGIAAPRIVDWNGDGLFDIVIGTIHGGVVLLENTGDKQQPAFDEIQTLVEPLSGKASSKVVKQVESKDGGPIGPGSSFHIEPVDYDGDGDLDLLVGARSKWFTDPDKEPTQAELDRAVKLRSESSDAYDQATKLKNAGATEEERDEIRSTEKYRKLIRKYHDLRTQALNLSRKPTETSDFIWLYRQK